MHMELLWNLLLLTCQKKSVIQKVRRFPMLSSLFQSIEKLSFNIAPELIGSVWDPASNKNLITMGQNIVKKIIYYVLYTNLGY